MSKASLRVYFVVHEGGRRTGTLVRSWESFFDAPPPSAFGLTDEDVYAELEAKLEQIRIEESEPLARYLWTEPFSTQKVSVDIHPLSWVKKRAVIGKREIPLVLSYAWCKQEGGGFRVMVPRIGAAFVVEELSLAADVIRQTISAALVGESPRWIYDYRTAVDEYVTEWSPPVVARARREAPKRTDEAEADELAKVADDLVARAAKGKLTPVVGEPPEWSTLRQVPSWTSSVLLVGPRGVGKSALVRRLAFELASGAGAPPGTPKRKLWSTSKDRIVAGMVYLGMWQARCLRIAEQLEDSGDLLHVSRLGDLLEAQSDGAAIADFFEAGVAAGELRILAECTEDELEDLRRMRPAFLARFEQIRVPEPGEAEAIALLHAYTKRKKNLDVHPSALRRVMRHLRALDRGMAFPGKGFRFVDWLAAETGPVGATPPRVLYPRAASEAYARYSGVPVTILADDVPSGSRELAGMLRARVIGQDAACDACGRLLARFKANLVDPERPCGTLLFVGPTGVGKTELAKQLTRTAFGSDRRMIRLDMSEYMLPGSGARLLDARAGSTSLATRVREQPLSLVLFDEIEKAHPEVFDLLLGVLGEARMTDASGRFVDFRTTIIVMTSNIGVRDRRPTGFGEAREEDFTRQVRAFFRPEMFNRIDHVLSFRALAPDDVMRIVELELASAAARPGFARRELRLLATDAAKAKLAELGYDPARGARPLKRVLEERVLTPIAARVAAEPGLRGRTLVVGVAGDASADVVV